MMGTRYLGGCGAEPYGPAKGVDSFPEGHTTVLCPGLPVACVLRRVRVNINFSFRWEMELQYWPGRKKVYGKVNYYFYE